MAREKHSKEFKNGYNQCLEDIHNMLYKFLDNLEGEDFIYMSSKINPMIIKNRDKSLTIHDIVNYIIYKK